MGRRGAKRRLQQQEEEEEEDRYGAGQEEEDEEDHRQETKNGADRRGGSDEDDEDEDEEEEEEEEEEHRQKPKGGRKDGPGRGSKQRNSAPALKKSKATRVAQAQPRKASKADRTKREDFEVDLIVAMRMTKRGREFRVRWKGCPPNKDTWLKEENLDCPDLLQSFLAKHHEEEGTTGSDTEEETRQYEVDKIIEVHYKRNGKREFLIRWKGYSSDHDTWEPEEHLNCKDLVELFMQKVEKAKSITVRELRINPRHTDRLALNVSSPRLRASPRFTRKQRATYYQYLD